MKNKTYDKKFVPAKYLNRYLSWNCSEEMQGLKLFPNLKEIQESLSILNVLETYVTIKDQSIHRKNENVICYVIGDGHTPRTAATIAFNTKWQTISIDPLMRDEKYRNKIQRCGVVQAKAEDVIGDIIRETEQQYDYTILIFPHSHITNTNEIYKWFKDEKVWIINMPCCMKKQDDYLPLKTWVSFKDEAVASPENIIKVYCNYLELV